MYVNAKARFKTDYGDIIEKSLPMDQNEIEDFVRTLGINPETFDYMRHFDKLPLSKVELDCSSSRYLNHSGYGRGLNDFIMFNFAAKAYEDLYDSDGDKVNVYLEYLDESLDPSEFVNVCLQVDDIDAFSYYYTDGNSYENLGKTLYADEIPDWAWAYVDWESIGSNESDYYCLGDEYYINCENCDEIDLTYYDFEEICTGLNFIFKDEEEYEEFQENSMTEDVLFNFLKGGGDFVNAEATC